MSIWVRSQNKRRLICCDGFIVNNEGGVLGFQGANDEGVVLGKYKSEERALEVLGYIHALITNGVTSDYIFKGTKTQSFEVFIMPSE
ncbi:hypothetical protein LPC13_05235 [Clostridium celatum]|uniref:hypothetical protein n=1 Tax=Clostridium celatum TaxID=36834 RepID=UPI001F285D52|nr:hypothetical protein [Clostridium celatum]MCE9654679.1 hypothetical protein [Clostridium celatum]